MTSPKARRRRRSTRLVVAAVLLAVAALAVLGTLMSGSRLALGLAALLAVALGAAAVKIMQSEVIAARREAALDRARQARSYRDLAEARSAEHRDFADAMRSRVTVAERAAVELETAVVASQHRAAEATRKLGTEARRADLAEAEGTRLTLALDESEQRAAEAIVRVAELEQESDVLRSELDAAQWTARVRHA